MVPANHLPPARDAEEEDPKEVSSLGEATDTFSNEVPPWPEDIIMMHKEVPVPTTTIRDGHHRRLGIVLPRSIVDIVMLPEEMIVVMVDFHFIPITSRRIKIINTEVVQVHHLLNHNVLHNVLKGPQGSTETEAAAIEIKTIRGIKRIQPRQRRLRFHRSK